MSTPSPNRFVPFEAAHLGALVLTAVLGYSLVVLVCSRPRTGPLVRAVLFVAISLLLAFELGIGIREGWLTWPVLLPLHLCDAAMVLALVSLVRPLRSAVEILYFWAVAGSGLAMLTPDLPWGFPRWEFVVFFGLHGMVLVAAVVLVFGLGLRPRRGAAGRAFLATLVLAGVAGAVDAFLGTNFMFLRGKPPTPTLLDYMGPWPVYIAVGALVALVLFHLLALPFRRQWRVAEGG
jgi:hypothetical integral membrane protein (TIGR02206 family)